MPRYDQRKTKCLKLDYPPDALLRIGDFCSTSDTVAILPYSDSAVDRMIRKGEFPRGIALGNRHRVWPAKVIYEIRDEIIARMEGKRAE